MRRRLPAIAVAALLGLVATTDPAHSKSGKGDYIGQYSVAVQGGFAIPNTDEFDNTFFYQGSLGYSPIPWLEVSLGAGRFQSNVSQPEPHGVPVHTIATGDLEVIPLIATVHLRYPMQEIFSTFTAFAGAGYYLVDYEMGGEARRFLDEKSQSSPTGETFPQTVGNDWGFHLGVGIEYHMTDHLSLVGEGRYIILSPAMSGSACDEAGWEYRFSGSLDLNTWLFTGGIKVAF